MDSILEIPEIYAFCDGAASGNGKSHVQKPTSWSSYQANYI